MTEEPNKGARKDKIKFQEGAIRESEARYRSLFEDSPISLWEEDFSEVKNYIEYLRASGINDFQVYFDEHPEEVSKCASMVRINDINKATLELLEAKNKEDLFTGLPKIFTEEALTIFKEELIMLCEGGETFESEAPHRTIKGNLKIVNVRMTLVPEYRKTWSKVFISLADITELKNVEKNLKIKENAIDSSINAVAIADLSGKLSYVNPSFLEMWGYSTEKEVLGKKAISFWKTEKKASEIISSIKETGKWLGELVAKRKDGTSFNVQLSANLVIDDNDNPICMMASFVDISERLKIENALKESQSNLETLFNSLYDFIFVLDLEGRIINVNQTVIKRIGYSEQEIQKMHVIEIHPPNRRDEAAKIVTEMIAGKRDSCNLPIMTKKGDLIPVDTKISRGYWGNQEVLFGISRDINEQLKAEDKIRESEEKFRTIAEQGLMGVVILQDNVVKYINQQHAAFLGYTAEEILNWEPGEWWKTIHPDDKQLVLEQVKRKEDETETGVRHYAARGINKKGQIFWLEVWFKTIKYQNRNAFLTTYIDITEKKNSEEKLRESEEKYRSIFENSPFSIMILDPEGYIRDFNPAFEDLSGYSKKELIGKNYFEHPLVPKKYLPTLLKNRDKLLKRQSLPLMEMQIKKKNKRLRWIHFVSSIINLDNNMFIQLIGHDITDRKKAQEDLIDAYERTNFYKDLFAHDMKNILHSISSSIELYSSLKDDPEKRKELNELLKIIEEQTNRGISLISNVDKLSEIEESKGSIKEIEVLPILNEAIEFVKNSFQNREINIKLDIKDKKKYFVNANALLLDVFENLLINSVKHNDNPNVEIEIKISEEKKRRKNYVKLEFIDNGIGIPDTRKEIIFQRSSERSITGMGLGLSLVKFIIDSYEGDILVKNRIRGDYTRGSNFIIFIPEA
ncbi:MAG: PAS domain S-box protein [Promethearchaeota archaeon]|nr:MAG: PAS domain S-box protein [Candidatus Lokiarchaeota archaeon]